MQRQITLRSLAAFICLFSTVLLFLSLPALAADDQSDIGDSSSDNSPTLNLDDPVPTGTSAISPAVDMPPVSPAMAVPTPAPAPDTTSSDLLVDTAMTRPTHTKTEMVLPTVMFIPPNTSNNPNALDPFFPKGSESCQKCKYFYPKLKECNQIASTTLARIPLVGGGGGSNVSIPLVSVTSNSSTATVTTSAIMTTGSGSGSGFAPAEFTTLLPFLQCICPNQGLAATQVCLTCFRISNQRNFLDQLESQNVTNSLSAFQEACLDSQDGRFVPPPANRGPSASSAHRVDRPIHIQYCYYYASHVLTGTILSMLAGWSMSFL
ncbi:hypothetical protein BGZ98_000270 [Dissophora globulifera]|nr:hypothetical protein BGZ98_000270 [Dissophora globulifera]